MHFGQAATVRAQRQHVLAPRTRRIPERFVNGRPHPAELPTAVWINPPPKKTTAQDAPGTTIVTAVDLRVDPILDADDPDAGMIDRPQRDPNYFDLSVSMSLTASACSTSPATSVPETAHRDVCIMRVGLIGGKTATKN